MEVTIALAETSQLGTDTQTRTSGGMSFIGNDNLPIFSIWKQSPFFIPEMSVALQ